MQIYLFEYATVTNNYHNGGALMVVAKSEEHVKELLVDFPAVKLDEDDWKNVRVFDTSPYELPEVFIFPDSGCC